jgi:hypothetical protein
MNQLVATMILTGIVIVAIGVAVFISTPLIESSKDASQLKESEFILKMIDNSVREVVKEGQSSRRLLGINSPGSIEVNPAEDAVQITSFPRLGMTDYLTRSVTGNLVYISGSDVSCSSSGNLTLENSYLKVVLRKTDRTAPLSAVRTAENLVFVTEKTGNAQISFANTSIVVDDNASSSSGTGYSELLKEGSDLPACTAHFFVDSPAADYDIYYTLYAGADFLTVDIRNVKTR